MVPALSGWRPISSMAKFSAARQTRSPTSGTGRASSGSRRPRSHTSMRQPGLKEDNWIVLPCMYIHMTSVMMGGRGEHKPDNSTDRLFDYDVIYVSYMPLPIGGGLQKLKLLIT